MSKYLVAALLVFAAPSLASANGGGNTKGNGSIKVTNNTTDSQVLLVAVDPSSSVLSSQTVSQFKNRGGRVVNPGGSTTFGNLKVGNHSIAFLLVDSSDTSLDSESEPSFRVLSVSKNVTTQVAVPNSSSSSSN